MSSATIQAVITSSVLLLVPVLWAAAGEAVCESAGVLNIGIEGVMLFGAFTAATVVHFGGSLWQGWLLAAPAGALMGAILWFLYVYRGCDQIVTGIMFNLLALGATTELYTKYLTGAGVVTTIPNLRIPGAASIPWIGPALFDQTPLFYLGVAGCVVLWFVLWHTWYGLSLRSVGERPDVATAAGLSVLGLRFVALTTSCVFAALGGAALTVISTGSFNIDITSGQGFIALAIVILGRWNPLLIILGAWLFGLADALQFQLVTVPALAGVPHDVWLAVPYLITIAVVIFSHGARYPAATGIPFAPVRKQRRLLAWMS